MYYITQLIYSCANSALLYWMSPKNEPLLVKYCLRDYKLKIIENLCTLFSSHFYIMSKNLVANYASRPIAKLRIMLKNI